MDECYAIGKTVVEVVSHGIRDMGKYLKWALQIERKWKFLRDRRLDSI